MYDDEYYWMVFVNLGLVDGELLKKFDGVGVYYVVYIWDSVMDLMDVYK